MVEYIATDRTGYSLLIGDEVVSHNGIERGAFGGVVGEDIEGGGMLILVDGVRSYAAYWGVSVDEIEDEPDFDDDYDEEDGWVDGWSDAYDDGAGYFDEYDGDLHSEYENYC